eukprot:CAMPEP_0201886626 /NCGR_PEP_ID=MMETSP0902-20130614/22623_1 /ASSEMBLY_ACC=CAM_ASM_000551 /TAXON_ID=420261 /ORGANISM="Thalassiosira antarctica, Strain CCMP982" /LENGTH=655 /DNA_ID=CAMNT_0048416257 /DNA_START=33 /DNA_END=2000 /DNA_ORIENTATION=-
MKSGAGNNNFSLHNSSHYHVSFSTISFDENVFNSNASPSSYESVDSQSSSLKQSPTQNKPITPQLSEDAPSSQKFQQQIQQWVSTNPKTAPYKAEESLARLWVEQQDLFRQWEQQQTQPSSADASVSPPTILLTTEAVNLVIQAWCNSNKGEIAAERAERLLRWMEDLHSPDSDSSRHAWSSFLPKPNYQSYATAIDAWSRSAVYESAHPSPVSSSSSGTETKSGGRAKNVISHATKAGFECAKRAEDLLMHMQRMHEQQLQMTEKDGQFDAYNSELQPDTRVFNLVLKAWSIFGGTKASAIRAMRILDLMQELHHGQSMNAPEWQGIVLSKVQPNLQTYKLVIDAWAHVHTVEGPGRAEEILRHLLSLSKAGNLGVEIMPDVECFHIVMKAHAESVRKRRKGDDGSAAVERAQKVTALLDWMELLALRSATSKIRPTTESYRIALSAWVWSNHVDAPKEAESILYRMIRSCDVNNRDAKNAAGNDAITKNKSDSWVVRPETRDFNTVINCCSFARKVGADPSEEDDDSLLQRQIAHHEIFDIAGGALDALLSSPYAQADPASFAGIIRACLNLLPNTDHRDDRVIELFRSAYRTPPSEAPSSRILSTRMRAPPGAGCVDANVLRQLRHALPSTEDYIRVREEFEKYRHLNAGEE